MRDLILESQKRGEIISRHARDAEDESPLQTWEQLYNVNMPPRRAPWKTIGVSNEDIVDSASEKDVPITPKNLARFFNAQSGRAASGGNTVIYTTVNETNIDEPSNSIKVCTGFQISGNNLIATFKTIRLYGTVTAEETETVLEGTVCEDL